MDSRNDVIASSAVLAGCAVEYLAHVNVDGFMGLAVALFILWSGIGIARETISPLLGKRADGALVERISRLVLSHDKVLGIHDLLAPRLRAGPVLRLGPCGAQRPGRASGLPRYHR